MALILSKNKENYYFIKYFMKTMKLHITYKLLFMATTFHYSHTPVHTIDLIVDY